MKEKFETVQARLGETNKRWGSILRGARVLCPPAMKPERQKES
jgi:hypothetical protein